MYLISGCYPYFTDDPFIIEECPHVYFAGNQPCFQHRMLPGKLLACAVNTRA